MTSAKEVGDLSSKSGDFFAISKSEWARLFASTSGINAAVAYLVLARFTAADNLTTNAGVHAIEKHTGIGRLRAGVAMKTLIEKKMISAGPVRLVAGHSSTEYQFRVHLKPEMIWLPNALVTGASTETPPLERVRQTQDPKTLQLLVDLYSTQNLREDGGIARSVMRQTHERQRVGQSGAFTVWGFDPCGQSGAYMNTDPLRVHIREPSKGKRAGRNVAEDFYRRFGQLERMNLVGWVPHIFESDGPEAESLFSFSTAGADLESALGAAAHGAGSALLTDGQRLFAENQGLWLVPIPAHLDNVQMIGVARLRYVPRTTLTGAWFAHDKTNGKKWLETYRAIAARAEGRATA
jgi:hypothetical protein